MYIVIQQENCSHSYCCHFICGITSDLQDAEAIFRKVAKDNCMNVLLLQLDTEYDWKNAKPYELFWNGEKHPGVCVCAKTTSFIR